MRRAPARSRIRSKNNFGFSQLLFASPARLPDTPSMSRGGRFPGAAEPAFPEPDTSPRARARVSAHTHHIGFLSPEHQGFAANMCGGCLLPTIPTPSSIRPVLFGVLLSRLVLIDFFFHFFFLSLGGSIAGCSRAEDLSTADQAEGEAGRTGAETQPDPVARPGPGGSPPAAGGSSGAGRRRCQSTLARQPRLGRERYLVHSQQWR